MKVLIGSLVRDRLPQLAICLRHLRTVRAPRGVEIARTFLLDNCAPGTGLIVAEAFPGADLIVRDDGGPEYRRENGARHFDRMARLRNLLREEALLGGFDALLSVDSDVAATPDLLERLLETGRPWVAALVDNSRGARRAWNILWHKDAFPGHYERREPDFERGGPAGVVGAACLYRREVLARVEYLDDARGEDVGFARSAAEAGIGGWYVPLVLDHLMTDRQVRAHLEGCPLCGSAGGPLTAGGPTTTEEGTRDVVHEP